MLQSPMDSPPVYTNVIGSGPGARSRLNRTSTVPTVTPLSEHRSAGEGPGTFMERSDSSASDFVDRLEAEWRKKRFGFSALPLRCLC